MKKDPCYGCNHTAVCFIKNNLDKGYQTKGRLSDCPCSICLIKSVCNKLCKEFMFHYGKVFGLENMDTVKYGHSRSPSSCIRSKYENS